MRFMKHSPSYTPHPNDSINSVVQAALKNMHALERAFAAGEIPAQSPPIEASQPLFQIVQELYNEGNFIHAAPLAFQLAVFHPEKRNYVYRAAQIFQRLSIFETAATFYALSMKDKPSPAAYYGLGQCLTGLNKNDLAIRHFETAIELARGDDQWRALQDCAAEAVERLRIN